MKALILAAGRGVRLRPLTDKTPKPLLPIGDVRLCDWNLAACFRAGITDVVMNTAHLADKFQSVPAFYEKKGIHITLSNEGSTAESALESLGGIVKALPLLSDGQEPFLVLAGDIAHDFDLKKLMAKKDDVIAGRIDAHLICVANPSYHTRGDLNLTTDGRVIAGAGPYTYGCLMIVAPRIFAGLKEERAKLFPWLWGHKITGEVHRGFWSNVGDPTEYEALIENKETHRWARWEV